MHRETKCTLIKVLFEVKLLFLSLFILLYFPFPFLVLQMKCFIAALLAVLLLLVPVLAFTANDASTVNISGVELLPNQREIDRKVRVLKECILRNIRSAADGESILLAIEKREKHETKLCTRHKKLCSSEYLTFLDTSISHLVWFFDNGVNATCHDYLRSLSSEESIEDLSPTPASEERRTAEYISAEHFHIFKFDGNEQKELEETIRAINTYVRRMQKHYRLESVNASLWPPGVKLLRARNTGDSKAYYRFKKVHPFYSSERQERLFALLIPNGVMLWGVSTFSPLSTFIRRRVTLNVFFAVSVFIHEFMYWRLLIGVVVPAVVLTLVLCYVSGNTLPWEDSKKCGENKAAQDTSVVLLLLHPVVNPDANTDTAAVDGKGYSGITAAAVKRFNDIRLLVLEEYYKYELLSFLSRLHILVLLFVLLSVVLIIVRIYTSMSKVNQFYSSSGRDNRGIDVEVAFKKVEDYLKMSGAEVANASTAALAGDDTSVVSTLAGSTLTFVSGSVCFAKQSFSNLFFTLFIFILRRIQSIPLLFYLSLCVILCFTYQVINTALRGLKDSFVCVQEINYKKGNELGRLDELLVQEYVKHVPGQSQ